MAFTFVAMLIVALVVAIVLIVLLLVLGVVLQLGAVLGYGLATAALDRYDVVDTTGSPGGAPPD